MKKNIHLITMFVLAAVLLQACRPDSYKSVGTPVNALASLAGTWQITKVIQTDENAKNNGFNYGPINIQTMDLTSVFAYTDFKLTLNFTNGVPSTFTTTPGNSPKIIRLASGNWSVDNPSYPQVLTFANATDTARVTLGAYPVGSTTPVLKIAAQKRDASSGKLLISYSYEFSKK
ncbi:MAG: DUF5004 domain-containing protein [Filimonas sp.]|nr:DUF5004 domain-containing protein [Filimonas sp.]